MALAQASDFSVRDAIFTLSDFQRGIGEHPHNFHSLVLLTALERESLKVVPDGQGGWEGLE